MRVPARRRRRRSKEAGAMIVVMKKGATERQIEAVKERLAELGFRTHPVVGEERTVIAAIGDKRAQGAEALFGFAGVEKILPILKPYKLVSKEVRETPVKVRVGEVIFGGERIVVIAGPCAVESESQIMAAARAVKEAGCHMLRGGAFKPRTSPYSFQGLEEEGLKLLARARTEFGLPVVTEVMDTRDVPLVAEYADMLQIGARNMQNFRLLKEVGKAGKPVLLKRGMAATVEEMLMAAEYIVDAGNPDVVLCERGIRTYENGTRNTLDLSAVPLVKDSSCLPIIVDPSHGTGHQKLVRPMSRGAVAVGADGVMLEVHPDPEKALCDGHQSLPPATLKDLMEELRLVASVVGRVL